MRCCNVTAWLELWTAKLKELRDHGYWDESLVQLLEDKVTAIISRLTNKESRDQKNEVKAARATRLHFDMMSWLDQNPIPKECE